MCDDDGIIEVIGSTDIPNNKLVSIDNTGKAILSNFLDLSQVGKVIGITTNPIRKNKVGLVQFNSTLNGFVGLDPGHNYWVGSNGNITSVVPSIGFIQRIGIALSSSTFYIKIDSPIIEAL